MEQRNRLFADLEARAHEGSARSDYYGADLRDAGLAGLRLSCFSLRGAILDGADLSGARFIHVDLSGASLRGANLERATFHQVSLVKASLAGARCAESIWRQADLTGAECMNAGWREAYVGNALLERADFADADLTLLRLIDCNCAGASFRGADFARANTAYSRFTDAHFEGAKRFSRCREIVVEILAREIGDDTARARLVGALALQRDWCYAEWAQMLAQEPHQREAALELFRRYPDSGFREAWRGTTERAS
jgi:uncharacterized protein YjbI with pentapeptide repeats